MSNATAIYGLIAVGSTVAFLHTIATSPATPLRGVSSEIKAARQETEHWRALVKAQDRDLSELREVIEHMREVIRANGLEGGP